MNDDDPQWHEKRLLLWLAIAFLVITTSFLLLARIF